jgi:flagellin-like hook-associated protein FlgL
MAQEISLTAGMRNNLLSLQQTTNNINSTQSKLASGKKVNSPLDNPTNFFAAQNANARATDLTNRKDGMSEAIQMTRSADTGIKAITALIQSAQGVASAAAATTSATDRANYANTFNTLLSQISQLASDSGYRGTNLLTGDNQTVEFGQKTGDATLKINGFTATSAGLKLDSATISSNAGTGGLTAVAGTSIGGASMSSVSWNDSGATADATLVINSAATELEGALSTLRTESSKLSSNLSVVTTRQDFTSSMINTLKEGADNLTLADMNEEGANMLMLQTRQNLGITSLSMASQAAQAVLRLF